MEYESQLKQCLEDESLFTDEQCEAVYTHDKNIIMMAGAGSGKTFVLVERYLALLETHQNWQLNELVAITFTRKAAQEMRDRVRQALETRLTDSAQADKSDDIMRWSALLAQMDSARIDTIHGLCATILRANAAEAEVDPDFVVMDETESAILLDDVVDDFFAQIAVETKHPALSLLNEYGASEVRDVLTNSFVLGLTLVELPDDLLTYWQQLWVSLVEDHLGHFLDDVASIGTVVGFSGDRLGEQWLLCNHYLDLLHQRDPEYFAEAIIGLTKLDMRWLSAKQWGDKTTFEVAKSSIKSIRELATALLSIVGNPPDTFDERAVPLIHAWLESIRRVATAYQETKAQNSVLDFDDLERLTAYLLKDYPEVTQRYQGRAIKHLLVDEFQDTNQQQWDIIKGLTDLDNPGSLFVVGDEKQSIYGFRGADVSVFGDVQDEIVTHDGVLLALSKSFRTHQPLIDLFNHLFSRLLVKEKTNIAHDYQVTLGKPMTSSRVDAPEADTPLLDFLIINSGTPDPLSGKPINTAKARRWEAYEIAQVIKSHIGKTVIYDKGEKTNRPMQYDDIAILFRALTDVNLYEEVFKSQGIPFVTIAGRGYYNRQEVWDLLNLLQALVNPADNLSLATALRSPLFGLSDDALYALRLVVAEAEDEVSESASNAEPMPLWDALAQPPEILPEDERERVEFARETLYALHKNAGRVTISELLRNALAKTGYLATLSGLPDGARLRGNVEKLVQKAQSSGKISLNEFSLYLRDMSEREVKEGEAVVDVSGAITIMSIHASKGLEFPLVVLADASRSLDRGGGKNLIAYDPLFGIGCKVYDVATDGWEQSFSYQRVQHLEKARDSAESLRLLYVALTRAQDRVLISGNARQNKDGTWKPKGYLGLILDTLDLNNLDEVINVPVSLMLDSGEHAGINIAMPEAMPTNESLLLSKTAVNPGWDTEIVKQGQPFGDATGLKPPLLDAVPVPPEAKVRHIAATDIANLGGAEHEIGERRRYYQDRFRRKLLHDAPAVVEYIGDRDQQVKAHQIGEIVHEVLRWWKFPGVDYTDDEFYEKLRRYAWRQGITDLALCEIAARQAFSLVNKFMRSEVYAWIDGADEKYQELPFIYERENRIIHGIIDTLYRKGDRWVIVDYKTSAVQHAKDTINIDMHARRYHLQVGVYALAVSEQLGGLVPETYVHYIRYTHVVPVAEQAWRKALSRSLSERIVDIIDSKDA